MAGFILRFLISALGLWLAAAIVSGIEIKSIGTLLAATLLLGIVNAVVRPLLIILTFPITLLTLGLFLLVINAATFGLVAYFLPGFSVAGLASAIFGAIIVGVTSWAASWLIGPRGRIEVIYMRGRR